MTNLDKLKNIATLDSGWIDEAKERQKNKAWLKHSQKIAINVLSALREKNIKQTQLAVLLGVSAQQVNKIVKGKENLTLETISKIELALNIKLLFAEKEDSAILQPYQPPKAYFPLHACSSKTTISAKRSFYPEGENYDTFDEIELKLVSNGY